MEVDETMLATVAEEPVATEKAVEGGLRTFAIVAGGPTRVDPGLVADVVRAGHMDLSTDRIGNFPEPRHFGGHPPWDSHLAAGRDHRRSIRPAAGHAGEQLRIGHRGAGALGNDRSSGHDGSLAISSSWRP